MNELKMEDETAGEGPQIQMNDSGENRLLNRITN